VTRSTAGKRICRVLPILLVAYAAVVACDSSSGATPAASTPVTSAAPSVVPSATTPTHTPAPAKPKISKAGLSYFFAVALGSEYGDKHDVVTMWTQPEVTVHVHGSIAKNKGCLDKVVSDFNEITATTDLKLTKTAANIDLYFVPRSKFRTIVPGYVSGNDGYVNVYWSGYSAITRADIVIRSSGISQSTRCHLIREELTQAMGLLQDSDRYPDSIFYERYRPSVTRYSKLDKEVIRLL
jgi:hypothetical protein